MWHSTDKTVARVVKHGGKLYATQDLGSDMGGGVVEGGRLKRVSQFLEKAARELHQPSALPVHNAIL